MVKVNIESEGHPVEVAVDGAPYTGPVSAGGSSGSDLPGITTKPDTIGSLGSGNDGPQERVVSAGEVIGYNFSVGGGTFRKIQWAGPGAFDRTSWAVFDSGGSRVVGVDNQLVSGTLGWAVTAELNNLSPGEYVFAVSVNRGINLGTQFTQR